MTCYTFNIISQKHINFYYKKKQSTLESFKIKTSVFPENKQIYIDLEKKYDWIIGGDFLNQIKNQINYLGVHRLMEKDIENKKGEKKIRAAYTHVKKIIDINISEDMYEFLNSNILLLKAIDSGTEKGKNRPQRKLKRGKYLNFPAPTHVFIFRLFFFIKPLNSEKVGVHK